MVLGNPVYPDEESRRKSSSERDRLEQVRIVALSFLPILMLPQIQRLRARLNAQNYDHDLADIQPRHPTTGRAWHSRNLKCTTCSDVSCPCCGRACCSYRACMLIAENDLAPANIRDLAIRDCIAIGQCFPFGRESPTFIQCTHGTGCGKSVCPDCCGICSEDCCQDVQCRVGIPYSCLVL